MKRRKSKKQKVIKPKLPTMKQMMTMADAAFSKYIRERDNWTCVVCGSVKTPQCGHLIRRSRMNVRFSENNCNCQCSVCNYRHEWFPEHYTNWFLLTKGEDVYNAIYTLAHKSENVKFSRAELGSIILAYTEKYGDLIQRKTKSLKF